MTIIFNLNIFRMIHMNTKKIFIVYIEEFQNIIMILNRFRYCRRSFYDNILHNQHIYEQSNSDTNFRFFRNLIKLIRHQTNRSIYRLVKELREYRHSFTLNIDSRENSKQ